MQFALLSQDGTKPSARHADVLSGQRALTGFANLLFHGHLTDIETCCKLFRREVLPAKAAPARFEIEAELTAQVLQERLSNRRAADLLQTAYPC